MTRIQTVPLIAALAVLGPAAGAQGGPEAVTATTTVTVSAGQPSEFRFTLSKKIVPRGTVVFRITNKGTVAHDFKIAGKKTALISPGLKATLRVRFTKAGRFKFLCTVAGHAAAGMTGILRVR